MAKVTEVVHPVIEHHLTQLRDRSTRSNDFRGHVNCLTSLLAFEASRDLQTEPIRIQTPLVEMEGRRLSCVIGLVPILRAGLGMVDSVLQLLPEAQVWHLGVYRDEATSMPVSYYSKLPKSDAVDVALILDPMLATGGSALTAIQALQAWGVTRIKLLSLIAAQPGIDRLVRECPDLEIYTCSIDSQLNDRNFIVPGLGDAGDRMFDTQRSHS